jgi:hypothetical protein
MLFNKLLILIIYGTFGYILGLYYGYQKTFIKHGPNSTNIRKNIYYEINGDEIKKYKLKPYII